MAYCMIRTIAKYWPLILIPLLVLSVPSYAEEPNKEMVPVKKINEKELNGKNLQDTINMFGEPSVTLKVNSTSSKRNMPPFLVDYFNDHSELVEVLVCSWREPTRSREICYARMNRNWFVIGMTTTIYVIRP